MKFNTQCEVPLKAKPTRCLGPLTVSENAKLQRHYREQVQKQAKFLSGLTWQQTPEFIKHKNGLSSGAGNITGVWKINKDGQLRRKLV